MFEAEKLRNLEEFPIAACAIDRKGRITFWNRCWYHWTGKSAKECEGKELIEVLPGFRDLDLDSYFSELVAKEEAIDLPISCLALVAGTNGRKNSVRDVQFQLCRCRSQGEEDSFLLLGTDVTSLGKKLKKCGDLLEHTREDFETVKRSEAQLARSQKKLKALNSELYSIGYTISHDLKAPLRHIDGFSEIMKDMLEEGDKEGGKMLLEKIQSSVGRMGELLDSVLRLSRVMGAEIMLCDTDIARTFHCVVKEMQLMENYSNLQVKVPQSITINADPGLVRLLVENLLGNALKYSSKCDRPKIEFGSFEKHGKRIFFLKDNGRGFPQEKAEEIFLPFCRLNEDAGVEGNGIGLSIVSKVMDRHGGAIWAEGAEDQGATFYFTFDGELIR